MKIIRSVSWILSANLVVSFSKWVILVIIARVLNPEMVGAYSLALAVGAPITLFANMKLRSLFLTEERYDFKDYIYARNVLSGLAFIILILVGIFIFPQYFLVISLVGLTKILDLQSEMYYAIPHKKENLSYVGRLMIIKHLITLTTFAITLMATNSLTTSIFTQLLIQLIFLVIFEMRGIEKKYKLKQTVNIDWTKIKKVILMGVPLGFVQMVVSFNTSYPRYLLEFKESAEILGYFSAIAYIVVIGNMAMNAIAQTFIPLLANKLKRNEVKSFKKMVYVKLTTFSLSLGSILILFSYVFGELFLTLIYGEEYAAYNSVLIIMSYGLTISFLNWNLDIALLAMRYLSIQPKISVVVLFFNLILGYLLINKYGIYGAAFTILFINIIQLALRSYFVNKKLKAQFKTV